MPWVISGANQISPERIAAQSFSIGLARAFGGALIFSLPILMTMEMWWLGFSIDEFRLALLLLLSIPLLIGLSHYMGFEDTFGFKDDALDAFVALAVGFIAGAVTLSLFSVIGSDMSASEIYWKSFYPSGARQHRCDVCPKRARRQRRKEGREKTSCRLWR